jgi:2-dehydro-3-deoxyphosphooctonate aldolase (KDO 8-P synthase)
MRTQKNSAKKVIVKDIQVGNNLPFVLIAGPDSLESYDRTFPIVRSIRDICKEVGVPYILKASYDKANRTSVHSFRGVGIKKGMALLKRFRKELSVPVTTDVHTPEEAKIVGEIVDLIQIPALLSRQTDLIVAAAKTGKPVNIKKGQFLSPYDIQNVSEKVFSTKNKNVLLTERGYMFGYGNLVSDMRSLEIMKKTGQPVIFDASHSIQLPSMKGTSSDGQREFIAPLARAAVAVGVAGVFLEVYDDPKTAPVDGPNSLILKDLKKVLTTLKAIDQVVKKYPY